MCTRTPSSPKLQSTQPHNFSLKRKSLFISFFVFIVSFSSSLYPFFDFKFVSDIKSLGNNNGAFSFLGSIETRKKQLETLEQETLEKIKQQSEDALKALTKHLSEIDSELELMKTGRESISDNLKEYFDKKSAILNERKQVLTSEKEIWEEKVSIVRNNIKLVRDIIETLGSDYEKFRHEQYKERLTYNWKEYQEIQTSIHTWSRKITTGEAKKETLVKQKTAEKERLSILEKQKETKSQEKDRILDPKQGLHDDERKHALELLRQEVLLISDKTSYLKAKIDKLDLEIQRKDDEIQLFQYKLNELEKKLPQIKQKLHVEISDVEVAKAELHNEKESLHKLRDEISETREKQRNKRDLLLAQLAETKAKTHEIKETTSEESLEYYEQQAEQSLLKQTIARLDEEIRLLDLQKDHLDTKIRHKEQLVDLVIIHYQITNEEKIPVENWLTLLKNRKDLAKRDIKILEDKRNEAVRFSTGSQVIELLRAKRKDLEEKHDLFKNREELYKNILHNLDDAISEVHLQQKISQKYIRVSSEYILLLNDLIEQIDLAIVNLEAQKVTISIWKRSAQAISFKGFKQSLVDAETFAKKFFWETSFYISTNALLMLLGKLSIADYIRLALFIIFFLLLFALCKWGIFWGRRKLGIQLSLATRRLQSIYLNTLIAFIDFIWKHLRFIFTWSVLLIIFSLDPFFLPSPIHLISHAYTKTAFYLFSIPFLLYLSHHFLICFKTLNKRLSFLFFTEKFQGKFIFLLTTFLYATSTLIPLRQAFINSRPGPSEFPAVILAAYTLILVIVLLFFFGKDDVLKLLPSQNLFFTWLKEKINAYYYPVFIFMMGLFILSNPYIGYSNLAWYLAFAVPSTCFIVYGVFVIHYYIRKYSVFFFIKEEDDDVTDKFEHARTYYGFFLIFAFLFLFLAAFLFIARIWGAYYTVAALWKAISQDWVITDFIVTGTKFGFVQFITLVLFVVAAFVLSSLINNFVLTKLFDIFRATPGTQNTVARILHYCIIFIVTFVGFSAIKLGPVVAAISGVIIVGAGFGLKDFVADFFAGFWVLIERPIELGHFIQTGDLLGTVQKIAVRATTIRTARNFSVVIPNRELVSKPIINWGGGRYAVGFEFNILIDYRADPDIVTQTMKEALTSHPYILRVPSIVIRLDEFGENGMLFFARAFISSRRVKDQWDIASEVRVELVKQLRQKGINIPYQQYVTHMAGEKARIVGPFSYDDLNEINHKAAEERQENDEGP